MVREYIGARYVPKFMGTYDATQDYEALCVVDNGSGTSYITKIPTPAGTPLNDTTYWAVYGATSGAIIHLQDQVDDINTKVSNIEIRNVLDYSAKGDGVTDDTTAIASALNDGIVLYFPPEHTYKITNLVIDKHNVTITGGGVIDGSIIIRQPWPNNIPAEIYIHGLEFIGANPIIIDRGVGIKIFENKFNNVEKAITIEPTGVFDPSTYSHVAGDINVFNNYVYFCDYFIYTTRGTITGVSQDYLYLSDMSIINNQVMTKTTHMYVSCCDGCIIKDNIFYHYGSSSRIGTKQRCIHFYHWVAGAIIDDNRLFEPGLEAIYLENAASSTIIGNHIVQPGQVNLSSAIKISSTAASGERIMIANNNIYAPSKYGIELKNAIDVQAIDNYIYNPASDYGYYGEDFGNPPMNSVTHYGVYYESDPGVNYNKITADNFASDTDHLYYGFSNNSKAPEQHITVTDTFDLTNATIFNCAPSSPITINAFNTSHLFNGQEITIVAYNGNLTIASTNLIRLKSATNYQMPANSVLQLKYMSGILWEVSRTET